MQRWAKRILTAVPQNNVTAKSNDFIVTVTDDENISMQNLVKDNEKLMKYLAADNASGHATNMDMLASSVNIMQHMREAIMGATFSEPTETDNYYMISFPFGNKMIGFKLSKAVLK